MHDATGYAEEKEIVDQKAIELAKDFSYDGYQVVRRELFAHLREPAVVIRRDSVTFNTACISGLEDAVYIQILVNQDNKKMVVRKCEENDKDALRWCIAKPDKRKSRKMSNRIFSAMMYKMMGWDLDCRYKILGHKITYEDETIYVFDLQETEIYLDIKGKRAKKSTESLSGTKHTDVSDDNITQSTENGEASAEEVKRKNRIPFYPKEWKDSFGLPVEEHKKALEINILDGYAEFSTPK
ncbi:MAG: integrase [Eubacteriales bacterium]|nr:integrase [Eubacteriales bacterium]